MKTTIQISEDLRNELKVIGSLRGMGYEETIKFLISVFKSAKKSGKAKTSKTDKEKVLSHLKSLGYI